MRSVHALERHMGESVFLNGFTGEYFYLHEELVYDFPSLFVDYLGHEASIKQARAE